MRAIIFAAGEGSRLRPLTWHFHKCCFLYKNTPLIIALIQEIVKSGVIDEVVVAVGRLGNQIKEAVRAGQFKTPIHFHDMAGVRGHARTVAEINRYYDVLGDDLFLIDGNIFVEAEDICGLVRAHRMQGAAFTVATRASKVLEPSCHYSVQVRHDRIIELRHPSMSPPGPADGWRSCPSYYAISPRVKDHIESAEAGWGLMWVAQKLVDNSEMVGSYDHRGQYAHLATPEDLEIYGLRQPPWSPDYATVREAIPSDASSITTIVNTYIGNGQVITCKSRDTIKKRRESIVRHAHFPQVVLVIDDAVAGFCLGHPFSPRPRLPGIADLSIYLRNDLVGKGLGNLLLQSALEQASVKGYHKLVAWVTSGNTRSEGLFEKNGFRRVGTFRRHARIEGQWIDRICYEFLIE